MDARISARQGLDVDSLTRDYGPEAPPIFRYDDKLDDEITVAQEDVDWLIPALADIVALVDTPQRSLQVGG